MPGTDAATDAHGEGKGGAHGDTGRGAHDNTGAAGAPASFGELVALLQQRLPALSPAHRLLAERVLADPEGVAFMTVSELAGAVGVNESTVVRFATGLGLAGYPGLTGLCRAMLRAEAQLVRRFTHLEALAATPGEPLAPAVAHDPLELAAAHDQANVARTFARVDRAAWAAAVTALAEAPRVHVIGLRKCHGPAVLLGYLLRLVRDDVVTLAPAAGDLVDELRRVREGDAVVGIAIHRYTRDTVRAFRWAGAAGATTVALTDTPASPLAALADHPFYVDTTGVAVLRSVTALTSLAQALANAVAAERGGATRDTLAVEERLLDEFGVYER
ncbi:MAG TPA: MurR/RpiR family transcriptional regulator [Acidimicrobiales bacterium]|nr:MurR/RpiR family transcriptional regulator [Acidimicrobiales bacterium]